MKLFEKKLKLKRGLSIALTYLLLAGIIAVISIFVLPNIVNSIIDITTNVPSYMDTVQGWINKITENEQIYDALNSTGVMDYLTGLSKDAGTILVSVLQGSVSSIFSMTANFVKIIFGFLISIYVLLEKENLIKGMKTLIFIILKEEKGRKFFFWAGTLNKMIGTYVGTKALDSLIIGAIALVGLLILRAPYAILIALVVGFTNMIPYFGPFIGEVVGAIVGIFVSPTMAVSILVFLLILQQFDAWYLDPKLIGNKVGLSPFFIIIGVTVGGGFFGPIGMILASPVMATLNIAYQHRVNILKAKNKNLMKRIESEFVVDEAELDKIEESEINNEDK